MLLCHVFHRFCFATKSLISFLKLKAFQVIAHSGHRLLDRLLLLANVKCTFLLDYYYSFGYDCYKYFIAVVNVVGLSDTVDGVIKQKSIPIVFVNDEYHDA